MDETRAPEPEPEADESVVLPDYRKLIIGLAGLAAIAGLLLLVKAAKPRSTVSYDMSNVPDGAEWLPTFQHFADAMEVRFAGIDNRLDDLANARVTQAAHVSEAPAPLVPTPEPDASANGVAAVSTEEPPNAPGPAAVST